MASYKIDTMITENAMISVSTVKLLDLYWKEFNNAIELLKTTKNHESSHEAIFCLMNCRKMIVTWLSEKRKSIILDNQLSKDHIDASCIQQVVDFQVVIWQIIESFNHTEVFKFFGSMIANLSIKHLLSDIQILIKDVTRFSIDSTLQALEKENSLEKRFTILNRFLSIPRQSFVEILDFFINVFIMSDLVSEEDKENNDFVDHTGRNKGVLFARTRLNKVLPVLLAAAEKVEKNGGVLISRGLEQLKALRLFLEENVLKENMNDINAALIEQTVSGKLLIEKNYNGLMKSTTLFTRDQRQVFYSWFRYDDSFTLNQFQEKKTIEGPRSSYLAINY